MLFSVVFLQFLIVSINASLPPPAPSSPPPAPSSPPPSPPSLPSSPTITQSKTFTSQWTRAYNELAAYVSDRDAWVSNISSDPFYKTPDGFFIHEPGDLLNFEEVTGEQRDKFTIPGTLTLYRMVYQSLDMYSQQVPASAFILLPYDRPGNRKLEVIVWAHGTAGIDRQCAPSNRRDLYYTYDAPYAMALRGYAVIAPDYAGLGTDTTFSYMAGPAHVQDVIHALAAARKSVLGGHLGQDWVIVGHSEGGMTAWIVNEYMQQHPESELSHGFRGSVAIAPAVQDIHIIRHAVASKNTGGSLLYSPYALYAIATINGSRQEPDAYLTEFGKEQFKLARAGCYATGMTVFSNLSYFDIVKDASWLNSSWANDWEERTSVSGAKAVAKPLLVIKAQKDQAVFSPVLETVFKTHCDSHPDTPGAKLLRYPDTDHDSVVYASQVACYDWIQDRFNHVDVGPGCSDLMVDPIKGGSGRSWI